MKARFTFWCLFVLGTASVAAQTTADFENFGLEPGQFLNNAENGRFVSGQVSLPNDYNEAGMFWQGWAISATTDTETPGFLNQYSAITGGGAGGSVSYAISYAFSPQIIELTGPARGAPVEGLYLTNTAYTYLGMRDGVGPAKAFGGPTGNDPDFLLLTIHGFRNGALTSDSVDFYLGDYRFADNEQDYLVDSWTWVDLRSLGNIDSLQFSITGSDMGDFGLNTPAYICLDQIITRDQPVNTAVPLAALKIKLWPNPTVDQVYIDWPLRAGEAALLNAQGQVLQQWQVRPGLQSLSLRELVPGTYWLRYQVDGQEGLQAIVRQ